MHSASTPSPRSSGLAFMALAVALLAGCASAPSTAPSQPTPGSASGVRPAVAPAAPTPAGGDEAALQQRFAKWIADFRATARATGISEATLRAALDDVQYLPRVIELDRAQPEFTRTVWDYLDSSVSPQRVATGQDKLLQVRGEADTAAARYGVPPSIVVAIWGMESNYGSNFGNTRTIDALATLGFDGRREDWARRELLAALKILDNGDIDRQHMVGSWAGAMGQTQFLPSNFLAYAVDADGDGRRDIWGSMADVIASTANFLARSGWQAGKPWGLEVRLPTGFDYGRADTVVQSTAQWAAEGLQAVDGQPLPAFDGGTILLPAGARGPAFLVGPNFRALLRYNNSTSYALGVSLLAQRLGGGPDVQTPWPRDLAALPRSQIIELQTALNKRGFDAGTADGVMGPATREGLRRYQRSVGLPADGYPSAELIQRLQQP
ncbi:lytic murein transglycosylase [Variovorax sp. J22G21]|uniref:lytic murein transglycosylase n=1 Tax=Variovorax fucosicus TaxID=3053517 RepID=UPI00257874F7|nr:MULTISPECIES: lytic murein transglycosylase [unclassified Variovorax]MDM0041199.1 lytic murein transglycosylase [Variovorax sp. J22R193]MDM0060256.1 lytic murein transglycosylase [Variovorax sp. J22G21]